MQREAIPKTLKTSELEKLQKELDAEAAKWEELGISLDQTHHSPATLFVLKCQVQALQNCLLKDGKVNTDNLNREFKTLMLNDMISLRETAEDQMQEAKYDYITGKQRGPIVPNLKLLGPDGEEIKL